MNTSKQPAEDRDLSFEVRRIEWLKTNHELPDQPCQPNFFMIVWVLKGSGHYCIDMEKYPVADNTVFVVPPGRMQQLRPAGNISGYVLSFTSDFLYLSTISPGRPLYNELVAGLSRVSMLALKEQRAEIVLGNVIKDMVREFESYLLLRTEILSGLMNIFLIYLHRMATPVQHEWTTNRKVHLFNNFYSKVEKDFLTKRLVAEYASELSVTPNYLSDVVKRVTGYSASYHIQQRMVLEAKRMAMYSDANMKLIAYNLGFDDISHFSKFFKNAAGVNFSEFRSRAMWGQ